MRQTYFTGLRQRATAYQGNIRNGVMGIAKGTRAHYAIFNW
jgi:hypothetical protein